MCYQKTSIQLCSCSSIESFDVKHRFGQELSLLKRNEVYTVVFWQLKQFIRERWQGIGGMLIEPLTQIKEKLTDTILCDYMNQGHCFDFKYQPNEGDILIFEPKYYNASGIKVLHEDGYQYVSLIFRKGKWTIKTYNAYYTETEFFKEGVVEWIND